MFAIIGQPVTATTSRPGAAEPGFPWPGCRFGPERSVGLGVSTARESGNLRQVPPAPAAGRRARNPFFVRRKRRTSWKSKNHASCQMFPSHRKELTGGQLEAVLVAELKPRD
ncbi:unnamed protein product [Lota lota]